VTAGVLDKFKDSFTYFEGVPDLDFDQLTQTQRLQSIANQATTAIGNSVVRSGISTVISGGDLSDFEGAFKTSLLQSGVDALGEHMAGRIGAAVHSPEGLHTALRYIAHAGVGCIIGAASGAVNDSEESDSFNCVSGAGGAVVGELIGDIVAEQHNGAELEAKVTALENKLKDALGLEGITDLNNVTPEQLAAVKNKVKGLEDLSKTKKLMHEFKNDAIEFSKLGAALAAFAAGGNVNIAADAAENAVENNVAWFVVYGGMLLWTAYDLYALGEDIVETIDSLEGKTEQEQKVILLELAEKVGIEIATEVAVTLTGTKIIDKIADFAKKSGLGDEVLHQMNMMVAIPVL